MKKAEFIEKVQSRLPEGTSKKQIAEFLAAFEDTMLEDVFAKEDSIRLAIGTFSGFTKPARTALNPMTKEKVDVPEKHGYPKVRFSKTAKA